MMEGPNNAKLSKEYKGTNNEIDSKSRKNVTKFLRETIPKNIHFRIIVWMSFFQ